MSAAAPTVPAGASPAPTRSPIGSLAGAANHLFLAAAVLVLLLLGILPRLGLYHTQTVLSGSMRPAFSPGDVVVVTPEPLRDLRIGQVISYHIPVGDRHVETHRVIQVFRENGRVIVRTKGDANEAADPWAAQLHGTIAWRVRAVVPKLGWAIIWLRGPLQHILTVLLLPALLAVTALWSIWRRPDEDVDASAPAAPTA